MCRSSCQHFSSAGFDHDFFIHTWVRCICFGHRQVSFGGGDRGSIRFSRLCMVLDLVPDPRSPESHLTQTLLFFSSRQERFAQ